MILAKKGQVPWNKGTPMSEEARRKLSLSLKGKKYAPGRIAGMKGKKHSEVTKRKMREKIPWNKEKKGVMPEPWNKGTKGLMKSNSSSFKKGQLPWNKGTKGLSATFWKGKKLSKDHKRNLSEAHIGLPSPNKGKRFSKDHKRNLSEAHIGLPSGMKGKHHSEEAKRKNSENHNYIIYPKEDTKPEKLLQALLTAKGIKFEKHTPFKMSGRPYYHKIDLLIQPNICIEVDGPFDHASPHEKNADGSMKYPDDHVMRKAHRYSKEKTAGYIRAKDKRITK